MTDNSGSRSKLVSTATTMQSRTVVNRSAIHFYQNDKLATEISAQGNRHILWAQGAAITQFDQTPAAKLLHVDRASSILRMPPNLMTYTPYGHLNINTSEALLAFNGQWYDPVTQGYPLGNGHRILNTVLMRFYSPDSLSPFEKGGLNTYSYCAGDPINNTDPSGQIKLPFTKRDPISTLSHYNKKFLKLNKKATSINEKITHYEDKISILREEMHSWRLQMSANNSPDQHGNTPSHYVAGLRIDIETNKSKLRAQEQKLNTVTEKIKSNNDKLVKARSLLSTQVPDSDNSLPMYAKESIPLAQQQIRTRQFRS